MDSSPTPTMTDATTTARYACVAIVCEKCLDPIDPADTLMGVCRDRWACDRRRRAHTSAPPPPRTTGEQLRAEKARRDRERRASHRLALPLAAD